MESLIPAYSILAEVEGVSKQQLAVCIAKEVFSKMQVTPTYSVGAIVSTGKIHSDDVSATDGPDDVLIGIYDSRGPDETIHTANWFADVMKGITGTERIDGIELRPIDVEHRRDRSFYLTNDVSTDVLVGYHHDKIGDLHISKFSIETICSAI